MGEFFENLYEVNDYNCECPKCGHTETSTEHCKNLKCPKCGTIMRRKERPGKGKDTNK